MLASIIRAMDPHLSQYLGIVVFTHPGLPLPMACLALVCLASLPFSLPASTFPMQWQCHFNTTPWRLSSLCTPCFMPRIRCHNPSQPPYESWLSHTHPARAYPTIFKTIYWLPLSIAKMGIRLCWFTQRPYFLGWRHSTASKCSYQWSVSQR